MGGPTPAGRTPPLFDPYFGGLGEVMVWSYPDSVDGVELGLASGFKLAESVLLRLA